MASIYIPACPSSYSVSLKVDVVHDLGSTASPLLLTICSVVCATPAFTHAPNRLVKISPFWCFFKLPGTEELLTNIAIIYTLLDAKCTLNLKSERLDDSGLPPLRA